MHKTVTRHVEAKKLLSRRRQSEYSLNVNYKLVSWITITELKILTNRALKSYWPKAKVTCLSLGLPGEGDYMYSPVDSGSASTFSIKWPENEALELVPLTESLIAGSSSWAVRDRVLAESQAQAKDYFTWPMPIRFANHANSTVEWSYNILQWFDVLKREEIDALWFCPFFNPTSNLW